MGLTELQGNTLTAALRASIAKRLVETNQEGRDVRFAIFDAETAKDDDQASSDNYFAPTLHTNITELVKAGAVPENWYYSDSEPVNHSDKPLVLVRIYDADSGILMPKFFSDSEEATA